MLIIISPWGTLMILFLLGMGAITHISYRLHQQKQLLAGQDSSDSRPSTPLLEPHSIKDEQMGMVVRLKNMGEPLLLQNIIVDRTKSNFLHSWASPNQEGQKIGRKRILKMEFAPYQDVTNYKEAEGEFEVQYKDLDNQLYTQTVTLAGEKLEVTAPSSLDD